MQILIVLNDPIDIKEVILVPEDDLSIVELQVEKFWDIEKLVNAERLKLREEFSSSCEKEPVLNLGTQDLRSYQLMQSEWESKFNDYVKQKAKLVIPEFRNYIKESGADVQFMKWRVMHWA